MWIVDHTQMITLSYGRKAKIPSQIEIEKSILGQTAQLVPNQFRGRILSGHPVQGFEQNGLWRFKLRETNLKKAMAYLCRKKLKTALSLRSWKNSKYLRQLTFKTVKGSRCSKESFSLIFRDMMLIEYRKNAFSETFWPFRCQRRNSPNVNEAQGVLSRREFCGGYKARRRVAMHASRGIYVYIALNRLPHS